MSELTPNEVMQNLLKARSVMPTEQLEKLCEEYDKILQQYISQRERRENGTLQYAHYNAWATIFQERVDVVQDELNSRKQPNYMPF